MIATHEFGHTLGLAPLVHGDGRRVLGAAVRQPGRCDEPAAVGQPAGVRPLGDSFPTAPQHTIAINRYCRRMAGPVAGGGAPRAVGHLHRGRGG
jgi:hypothetical protein